MASKNLFHAKITKNSYIFVSQDSDMISSDHNLFEFEESDIWNNTNNNSSSSVSQFDSKKTLPTSRQSKKAINNSGRIRPPVNCSASLPVNIPDWSKIYKGGNQQRRKSNLDGHQIQDQESHDYYNYDYKYNYNYDDGDDDGDDDDDDERVPPHEYLARRRGASFSVHEGIGRTLKGRDLRQVRNAIWKKVGFED